MKAPYLKLYKDRACNVEIEVDEDGNFKYPISSISNTNISSYKFPIWIKNLGDSNAYDVELVVLKGNAVPSIKLNLLGPNNVNKIFLNMDVTVVGDKINALVVRLKYDSI